MHIKDLSKCEEFVAGDDSLLRELLNPLKEGLALSCSLAHARVGPGEETRDHRLRGSEVYYILQGRGRMRVDDEQEEVSPGQAIYIPPGSVQSIRNTGPDDLLFLCIVDPAWRPEDEEVLD